MNELWTVWGDSKDPVCVDVTYEEMVKAVAEKPEIYYGESNLGNEYEIN